MTGRRISIVLPDLRGGGAERVSVDLAKSLDVCGYESEFVLMSATGEFLEEAQARFSVTGLGVQKIRDAILPLSRYLRARRPAAVIANMWPLTSATVAARMLSRHHCPLLLVEHCALSRHYATWGRWHSLMMRGTMTATYRHAGRVAAVSEGVALDIARLAGLKPRDVTVLHNPIPSRPAPSEPERSAAEAMWKCPTGARILCVGSLKDQKNHRVLLQAFSRLARLDARLLLLGQGDNEGMLRALASELSVADRVVFAGFHTDPSSFYLTADLLVLSSDYEGLPTVLIESLSFGLPIVSTDCPSGPAEILENGKWGRLVPVGDARALASAMEEALAAPVDREALKRRAADFAPDIAAQKYLSLLGLRTR